MEEEEAENEKGGKEEEGKEVQEKEVQEKEEDKQEDKEEQVELQEGLDVQGLPVGLDAIVDGACADGVEAEGGAHHRQGVCQTHADAGVVCEAPSAGPGRAMSAFWGRPIAVNTNFNKDTFPCCQSCPLGSLVQKMYDL